MNTKKSLPTHLRLNKKPTEWLRNLPAGEYNIKDLQRITEKCSSTIKQRLNLLEIPKKYNAQSGYPLVVYMWVGIVEYERQNQSKQEKDINFET